MTERYKDIRDMTDEDRRDIHEFAIQMSREMAREDSIGFEKSSCKSEMEDTDQARNH